MSKISTANNGMEKKGTLDAKTIARRIERWGRCVHGAPGGYDEIPYLSSVYCCTNSNVGRMWRLEKWHDYIEAEGSSYAKHINIERQSYARFGTLDAYILRPTTNLIECAGCPEYKKKKSILSYW